MKTYRSGRIPCRCNKRPCQARRTLTKRPEKYLNWPTCPVAGCDGKLYVDEYRLRRGAKDQTPACKILGCALTSGCGHRISNKGCLGYEDYLAERNSKPRSKHSPIPKDEWVPF